MSRIYTKHRRHRVIHIEQLKVEILEYILEHPRCKRADIQTHQNIQWRLMRTLLREMRLDRIVYYTDIDTHKQAISISVSLNGLKYLIKNKHLMSSSLTESKDSSIVDAC